jgi:hypothetical protein
MEINMNKYCILFNDLSDNLKRQIAQIFPMKMEPLDNGVKYLGFILKPNNYTKGDWQWLIKKIEDRINCWCHRWLSRGGRLVLVKSVLESILVYWLSIAHIPKSIIERIHRKCSSFLWIGSKEKDGIPLVKWSRIATLKEFGGWGLKKLHIFEQALAAKSLWRLLFNKGLWGKVMRAKYLEELKHCAICLSEQDDELSWSKNTTTGILTMKLGYIAKISENVGDER